MLRSGFGDRRGEAPVADNDSIAFADARQAIRDYSDNDLLAFWAATEWAATEWAATETVQDEAVLGARETAVIGFAAEELVKRGLLPV
jgi:hypothetical protein